MKVSQEVECEIRVIATLYEDGTLSAYLAATACYDEGTGATTTVKFIPSPESLEAIRAALQAVLDAEKGQVHTGVLQAIATSRDVAGRLGELSDQSGHPIPAKEGPKWAFWRK